MRTASRISTGQCVERPQPLRLFSRASGACAGAAKTGLHWPQPNRPHGDTFCSPPFPLSGVPKTRRFCVDWGGRKGWGFCEATRGLYVPTATFGKTPQPLRKNTKLGYRWRQAKLFSRAFCSPSFPLLRKGWGFCEATRGLYVHTATLRETPSLCDFFRRASGACAGAAKAGLHVLANFCVMLINALRTKG
jgi:hypothetical protein